MPDIFFGPSNVISATTTVNVAGEDSENFFLKVGIENTAIVTPTTTKREVVRNLNNENSYGGYDHPTKNGFVTRRSRYRRSGSQSKTVIIRFCGFVARENVVSAR